MGLKEVVKRLVKWLNGLSDSEEIGGQVHKNAYVRPDCQILENVLKLSYVEIESVKKINWKVLVLDKTGMRIISSCCNMVDICYNGITLVEDLLKEREPLNLDAVYFLTPTQSSVAALINDFPSNGTTRYKAAHVYFTHACPDALFNLLSNSLPIEKIVSFEEINIAFIPFESQVFSLDSHQTFQSCYNSLLENDRIPHLDNLALQIASVCHALNEYPSVRYIKKSINTSNIELAQLVLEKLNLLRQDFPCMGEKHKNLRSQLIIIDRSYDWISLILHELTFQAMAYDNFLIRNNVFKFTENDAQKEVLLDDKDDVWTELKHQHISVAVNTIKHGLKKCVNSGLVSAADAAQSTSVGGLSYVVKKIPQQKKKVDTLTIHMNALKACMNFYGEHLQDICIFEQDLAMGKEAFCDKIKYDVKERLIYFLTNDNVNVHNKLRLIILYILYTDGVSEDIFNEIVQNAQLSPANIQIINNLNKLGINTIKDANKKKQRPAERRDRVDENTFEVSRWTPVIKDIIEYCVENRLDPKEFPYVAVKEPSNEKPTASRYNATWYKGIDPNKNLHGSRIIIFIIGGITFSEMRCAYEVSKHFKQWDIIVGSSHIVTPNDFIQDLTKL